MRSQLLTKTNKTGIIGYGVYIPRFRIKVEEIARIWGQPGEAVKKGLGVLEKSIPDMDEDTITISVEASRNAIKMAKTNPDDVEAVYVGSESHPYAVKPTATIVAEATGITPITTAADLEFACKAGTAALQVCYGLVKGDVISYGLAIGTDTAQAHPGDILEYSAAAAGAVFIVGGNPKEIVATIDATLSVSSDTPDYPWRKFP